MVVLQLLDMLAIFFFRSFLGGGFHTHKLFCLSGAEKRTRNIAELA